MSAATHKNVRIAVLSDLHAFTSEAGKSPPSFYDVAKIPANPLLHPISALKELIKTEHLTADMVLCGGDMSDKAGPSGVIQAWKDLHDVATLLKAQFVTGTCGNHDLDSRFQGSSHDAKGVLMNLNPPFPVADDSKRNQFWAKNYLIEEGQDYRVVVLNSCAFHGSGKDQQREIEHGRISPNTIEWLKQDLQSQSPKPVNILLCHHHPKLHPEIDYEDYEVMIGGEQLLHLLGNAAFGSWIVIHGHKHHPKIDYAAGGGNAPLVFSAGSLAAHLYPQLTTLGIRNQFYIIDIHLEQITKFGLAGTVLAWDWYGGTGWRASNGAHSEHGIPRSSGFGARPVTAPLANEVSIAVAGRVTSWSDLVNVIPALPYLLPRDVYELCRELRSTHNLRVIFDQGAPVQIGPCT